jgi:hypothetical protein
MRALIGLSFSMVLAAMSSQALACGPRAAHAKAAGPGCARVWMDRNLRLNDVMTVGTHNSYKQAISPRLYALIRAGHPAADAIDYHHPTLTAQLDDGARGLELDVAYDPLGGRFAHPIGPKLTGEAPPSDFDQVMAKPGFKVMHIQDIDFRSSCLTFVICLRTIKAWSDAHPDHIPILISINAKDDKSPVPGGVDALKFDTAAYDALDAEVRSVLAPKDLITPDDVQGRYPTLREAVTHDNWPTLGASRGKILFALDEDPPKVAAYRGPRKSLEGRVMFINTDETSPAAAYLTLNEALTDTAHIIRDVKANFLVRTRADADTVEARKNDVRRRDLALTSGAQYVSTDYRHSETRFSAYEVRLPASKIAVCNPQRRPERCDGLEMEPNPQ